MKNKVQRESWGIPKLFMEFMYILFKNSALVKVFGTSPQKLRQSIFLFNLFIIYVGNLRLKMSNSMIKNPLIYSIKFI